MFKLPWPRSVIAFLRVIGSYICYSTSLLFLVLTWFALTLWPAELNECVSTPDICKVHINTHCVNEFGTYSCDCDPGHSRLYANFCAGNSILTLRSSLFLRDKNDIKKAIIMTVIVNCLQSSIFDVQFGVPQGSVLGPVLYTLYTTPLGKIIKEHNINYHMYADDTQLYKSVPFSDLQLLVQCIETCSGNVKKWMTDNKLKMNNEKTEILLCGPKKYVESSDCDHICIEGENISFSNNARNLGVYFDCTFSMEHHVKQLCKSLFFELRKISHMRAFLNEASLQKLVTSFVLSRMDYCNSLLINLPNDTITKLQRIQNHAARLVLKKAKRDHVTPLFRKLHWLPLQARIDYKICVLCFKCINKTAPSYLSDLLEQYVPSRLLRSGSQNLLKIPPRANKKNTEKAFKHCAPYIWNSLPSDIREAKSESQFKNDLKTHLFKSHLCI